MKGDVPGIFHQLLTFLHTDIHLTLCQEDNDCPHQHCYYLSNYLATYIFIYNYLYNNNKNNNSNTNNSSKHDSEFNCDEQD